MISIGQMANFPNSLDSFTNPGAGSAITSPPHGLQHANANDAIVAIESKLGVGAGSATAVNKLLVGTGNGTSIWSGTISGIVDNNSTFGTPAITGGTITNTVFTNPSFPGGINNATLGTPTIQNPTLGLGTVTGPTGLDIALNADTANSKVVLTTVRRQGGSASDWSNPGTTNYTESSTLIQVGALSVGTSSTLYTVTFPVPFSQIPVIVVTQTNTSTASTGTTRNLGTAGFGYVAASTDASNTVHWIAIGKR